MQARPGRDRGATRVHLADAGRLDSQMLLSQGPKPSAPGSANPAVSPSPPQSSLAAHQQPRGASYPAYLEGAGAGREGSVGGDYRQAGQGQPVAGDLAGEPLTKPAQQLVTSPVDKWGLAALLRLLRTGGSNDLLALTLGEDLANIGLDMNSSAWVPPAATRLTARLMDPPRADPSTRPLSSRGQSQKRFNTSISRKSSAYRSATTSTRRARAPR